MNEEEPPTDVEVRFAEDGRTVFVWRYLGNGTALLWTYELGAQPGTTGQRPALIEGI